MKPLLDVLVILDALEKEGSFAAASAKLYKTPSALSYTVQKLESDLNIQILDRTGHRDAPRDKCAHFREINGIAAAFQYLQKNYIPTALSFL